MGTKRANDAKLKASKQWVRWVSFAEPVPANKQARKQAGKQAQMQARKQASKEASRQAGKQAIKQAKQAS